MTNKDMKSISFNMEKSQFKRIEKASIEMGLKPCQYVKMIVFKSLREEEKGV